MGRKATVNTNLPPHMRKRVKPSGRTYYYLDTGEKPRTEIPLGDDYIAALRKYADLRVVSIKEHEATFGDVIVKYMTEVLPLKANNTIRVQKADIKHLEANFKDAPLDQLKPMHINQFLQKLKKKPTTANRCKRLFSAMWNKARAWGYTDGANPCQGVRGHQLGKRDVYISDAVFKAVWDCGSEPLRDAMDLAYLTGQRPGDALKLTEHDIDGDFLMVKQSKTKRPLQVRISGELDALMKRIRARKDTYKIHHTNLLVNTQGKALTKAVLRNHFEEARDAAAKKYPDMADQIRGFWFYDLRAKAADDIAEMRSEEQASNLLGHESVRTTQRHYLRRGKRVEPTK